MNAEQLNTYNNGPEGMPRVERMTDSTIGWLMNELPLLNCLHNERSYEEMRQFAHVVAEEVLARVPAWPIVALVEKAAERAVSPAEIVQSVDTPEFHKLLNAARAYRGTEYSKETEDCLIVYVNAKLAFVHAEGRRSAREELAKEKERADKAEADAAMWAKRYSDALEAAARQAPVEPCGGCGNADPDKRCIGCAHPFATSTAQPLQQEGGKETLANGWPKDFHEVVKGAEDASYQLGHAAGLEEAAQVCERDAAHNVLRAGAAAADRCASAIRALAHPSDNLQQASTAQAEPAKMECPTCGVDRFKKPCPNMADECPMVADAHLLKPADSATDDEPLSMSMFASLEELNAAKAARAAQATPEGAELPPLPRAYSYLTGCNLDMEHSLEAAQAVCDYDNAAEMAIRENDPSYADPDWQPAKPEPLFDADQMRDYARAALASQQNSASNSSNNSATTAAEPVALRSALQGLLDRYVGLVVSGDAGNWDAEKESEVIAARAALAGHAAPPQQVE